MTFREDPTRIPAVLDAVRRAWEGQPDVPLATFFGILANHGVGWGAADVDLVAALGGIERVHPGTLPRVDDRVASRFLILTEAPAHRVTLDPGRVIVRRPGVSAQPGVWSYTRVRPGYVGSPLVIVDGEGIDHRLGVISRIILLDDAPSPAVADLSGVQRRDLGDAVHLVVLAEGETVLIDHGLHHFVPGRRALEQSSRAWETLVACRPGAPLSVRPPAGGPVFTLGEVAEILVVEDEPLPTLPGIPD